MAQMSSTPTATPASALQPLDLEKELSCSICTEILYQPLTLLDCLHTFCGSCLKEWFGWQAKAVPSTQRERGGTTTYTCPQCRSPVRDTKPNATVTTLLEMYLQANPSKLKSQDDRQEIAQKYKPGDIVLPLSPPPPSASSRHRRGEHELEDEEDARLLQEMRQLSIREMEGRHSRPTASAEHGSDDRRQRRRRRERSPPIAQEREASPHEAARRELEAQLTARGGLRPGESLRSLEHQGSLRTLMSRSGPNSNVSNAVQGDIMREILEGNLLDELDFSNIDEGDQEAVSELIARAYLERRRRGQREHGTQPVHTPTASSDATEITGRDPPVSRPHLLEPTARDERRRRRSANNSRSRSARSEDARAPEEPSASEPSLAVPSTEDSGRPRDRSGQRRHGTRESDHYTAAAAGASATDAATDESNEQWYMDLQADFQAEGDFFSEDLVDEILASQQKPPSMQMLWPRVPEEGPEHEDELEFPRHAIVREIVRMNEDWGWGVYNGKSGLFPLAFGRWHP